MLLLTERDQFGHHYIKEGHPFVYIRFTQRGKQSEYFSGFVDSGADNIMIPKSLADFLGLTLTKSPKPFGTAAGEKEGFQATIDKIEINRHNIIEYSHVPIGVIDANVPILVGRKPFFEDFIVIIIDRDKLLKFIRYDSDLKKKYV